MLLLLSSFQLVFEAGAGPPCASGRKQRARVHSWAQQIGLGLGPWGRWRFLKFIFTYSIFFPLLQFFHGTAPKPSLDQIHQAVLGFNNDPAQSETVRCSCGIAVFTLFWERVWACHASQMHDKRDGSAALCRLKGNPRGHLALCNINKNLIHLRSVLTLE